jgi:hypothetical protein
MVTVGSCCSTRRTNRRSFDIAECLFRGDKPRSAIISTRSRKLSLKRRYHRTQSTIISRSTCRPSNSSLRPTGISPFQQPFAVIGPMLSTAKNSHQSLLAADAPRTQVSARLLQQVHAEKYPWIGACKRYGQNRNPAMADLRALLVHLAKLWPL